MRIIVCAKQVVDPLITTLEVDQEQKKILGPPNSKPVINGFDEQALEAALRIKEDRQDEECEVIVLTLGSDFDLDVMKGALASGADELFLVKNSLLDTWDSSFIARVLAAAIKHIGEADLVLCGRQASDWDHALTPYALAEQVGYSCLSLARSVEVQEGQVQIERIMSDGHIVMGGNLPAVVTVTSELGELRYPSPRARLLSKKRRPKTLTLEELNVESSSSSLLELVDLSLHEEIRDCQFIEGADGNEMGHNLAQTLVDSGVLKSKNNA